MVSQPIAADVLGPEATRVLDRERGELSTLLDRVDGAQWESRSPIGGPVGAVVEHLAEAAERLADVVARRDQHVGEPLFEAVGGHGPLDLSRPPGEREAVVAAYRRAHDRLHHVLGQARLRDWSWPSWSPHGGMESLAETVRRWVAHHYVHRQDIAEATARPVDRDEATLRLVVEHVLDALARSGGEVVGPPAEFELVTNNPGAGSWTLRFDAAEELRRTDLEIWTELLGRRPDEPPAHRVERGPADAPRATVRATAESVWRAAFRRGGSWEDLEVHGDDEGIRLWRDLTAAVSA